MWKIFFLDWPRRRVLEFHLWVARQVRRRSPRISTSLWCILAPRKTRQRCSKVRLPSLSLFDSSVELWVDLEQKFTNNLVNLCPASTRGSRLCWSRNHPCVFRCPQIHSPRLPWACRELTSCNYVNISVCTYTRQSYFLLKYGVTVLKWLSSLYAKQHFELITRNKWKSNEFHTLISWFLDPLPSRDQSLGTQLKDSGFYAK